MLTLAEPEGVRRQRYGVPNVDYVIAKDYDSGVTDLDINDDAEWAKYVAEAKRMDVDRAVEIQQAGYDRMMSRLEK